MKVYGVFCRRFSVFVCLTRVSVYMVFVWCVGVCDVCVWCMSLCSVSVWCFMCKDVGRGW